MKPSIQLVRCLAVVFFLRIYKPLVIAISISFVCLIALSVWLTTFNSLWWVLFVIVIILVFIFIIISVAVLGIIRIISPSLSKEQKTMAKAFVEKMQRLGEVTSTPKIILLFRVAKDMIIPTENGFIASVSLDALSLRQDLSRLRDTFK